MGKRVYGLAERGSGIVRTVNETFTDEEFEQLLKAKGNESWHDFILSLIPVRKHK